MKRFLRNVLIVLLASLSIFAVFRLTSAGSLTPATSPGGTMNTADEISDPLVGTSYDSSGITGSLTGSALEVSRCIIRRLQSNPCP